MSCPSTGTHNTIYAHRRHKCRCPEAVAKMRAKRHADRQRPSARAYRAQLREQARQARAHIDEIAVDQACSGRYVRLTRPERHAAIDRLDARGTSARRIAERLHIDTRTVYRRREARRAANTQGTEL